MQGMKLLLLCTDTVVAPQNCTHSDVRLVGAQNAYEGRVEVCINNLWGTICDSGWSYGDASVVCRQAGFPGSGCYIDTTCILMS